MTKEMIISSSAHETRVAILEEDQVAEICIERDGFLYVSDVIAPSEEFDRFETEDDAPAAAGENGPPTSLGGNGGTAGQASAGRKGGPSGPPDRGGRRGDRDREKGPEPKIEE